MKSLMTTKKTRDTFLQENNDYIIQSYYSGLVYVSIDNQNDVNQPYKLSEFSSIEKISNHYEDY